MVLCWLIYCSFCSIQMFGLYKDPSGSNIFRETSSVIAVNDLKLKAAELESKPNVRNAIGKLLV